MLSKRFKKISIEVIKRQLTAIEVGTLHGRKQLKIF